MRGEKRRAAALHAGNVTTLNTPVVNRHFLAAQTFHHPRRLVFAGQGAGPAAAVYGATRSAARRRAPWGARARGIADTAVTGACSRTAVDQRARRQCVQHWRRLGCPRGRPASANRRARARGALAVARRAPDGSGGARRDRGAATVPRFQGVLARDWAAGRTAPGGCSGCKPHWGVRAPQRCHSLHAHPHQRPPWGCRRPPRGGRRCRWDGV